MTEGQAGEIEVFRGGSGLTFRYTPDQAKAWVAGLMEIRQAVLRKGVDYDVLPGGREQDVLLKPGAETLLMLAGLGFHMCQIPAEGHDGVTYRCSITATEPGAEFTCGQCGEKMNVVVKAQCEGYAGYEEDRYFQSAAMLEKKERANAEKYQRAANPLKWVEDYKAPLNTLMKMAQKRALVGATLNALAASGLFTQDIETEDHTGEPPEKYDPVAHVKPYLDTLVSKDARDRLRAWRDQQGLPLVAEMTQAQVEATLVQIGVCREYERLQAEGGTRTTPEHTEPDTQPPSGVSEVDGEGTEPFDDGDGNAEDPLGGGSPSPTLPLDGDQSSASNPTDATSEAEDPLAAGPGKTPPGPAGSSAAGDRAVEAFDQAIGYTPPGTDAGPLAPTTATSTTPSTSSAASSSPPKSGTSSKRAGNLAGVEAAKAAMPGATMSWEQGRHIVAGHASAMKNPAATSDKAALQLADDAFGQLGISVGPVTPLQVKEASKLVEPPAEGDASGFHRRAGGMGLSAAADAEIVFIATAGRTTHAGECDVAELRKANALLEEIQNGESIETVLAEATDLRRALEGAAERGVDI